MCIFELFSCTYIYVNILKSYTLVIYEVYKQQQQQRKYTNNKIFDNIDIFYK